MNLEELRDQFGGVLITTSDTEYDEARRVWNGMIDLNPALIARCTSTEDVVAALRYGRDNDLEIAVRGGGHNVSGNGTCQDGIVIDLGPMNQVRVDTATQIAEAGGGTTWAEYDAATQEHGLASPGGAISTTGVAGLTLGGGFGWLTREYGLACDNLISAEVVTANGDVVTASAAENPDLYWGLRGGGGNFGIVTSLRFRLHPVTELYAGLILFPRDRAVEFMRRYTDYTRTAPEQASSMAAFLHTPDGVPVVGAFFVYHGETAEGERLLEPIRALGSPAMDDVAQKPYTVAQQAFDPGFPKGLRNYWKSSFLSGLSDDCIAVLIEQANRSPSVLSILAVEHMMGGAAGLVGVEETAFGARTSEYNCLVLGMGADEDEDEPIREWARQTWAAIQPFSTGAAYVNYMSDDEDDRIAEAYQTASFDRLIELKNRYDPDNVFHRNQNIAPRAE